MFEPCPTSAAKCVGLESQAAGDSVPTLRQPVDAAVDAATVSDADHADDDALFMDRVDDAIVSGLRPVEMVRADDAVGQARSLEAKLGLDLAPRPRRVELAGRKSTLVRSGVLLVLHELGQEHVLDRDDGCERLSMTLDHEAIAAVGTATDDLRQLFSELARRHGLGVSEVIAGDAVLEVVGHRVIS